jgi:hypothetical protein
VLSTLSIDYPSGWLGVLLLLAGVTISLLREDIADRHIDLQWSPIILETRITRERTLSCQF